MAESSFTYSEREALNLVRKTLQRKPTEVLDALFKDMPKSVVFDGMKLMSKQLDDQLKIVRAMQELTLKLSKELK